MNTEPSVIETKNIIKYLSKRNITFTKEFSNEKEFAKWFEDNYTLFGFDGIISNTNRFPDYIMTRKGVKIGVELETMSGNFITHGHNPNDTDLVICIIKNQEIPVHTIELDTFEYTPPPTSLIRFSDDNHDWMICNRGGGSIDTVLSVLINHAKKCPELKKEILEETKAKAIKETKQKKIKE